MTSRGQCPMGGGACECLHHPLQEILYPRLCMLLLFIFIIPKSTGLRLKV